MSQLFWGRIPVPPQPSYALDRNALIDSCKTFGKLLVTTEKDVQMAVGGKKIDMLYVDGHNIGVRWIVGSFHQPAFSHLDTKKCYYS